MYFINLSFEFELTYLSSSDIWILIFLKQFSKIIWDIEKNQTPGNSYLKKLSNEVSLHAPCYLKKFP